MSDGNSTNTIHCVLLKPDMDLDCLNYHMLKIMVNIVCIKLSVDAVLYKTWPSIGKSVYKIYISVQSMGTFKKSVSDKVLIHLNVNSVKIAVRSTKLG
jgi:hypothetical protein